MKIRLLTSVSGSNYTYAAGDIVDVDESIGRDLVRANFATVVSGTPVPVFHTSAETATDKINPVKRKK